MRGPVIRAARALAWALMATLGLVVAIVTLRLWLPALLAAGFGFEEAYVTVAWLCWVPNLLVVEIYLGLGKSGMAARQPE